MTSSFERPPAIPRGCLGESYGGSPAEAGIAV
jgi:hypothetical protein